MSATTTPNVLRSRSSGTWHRYPQEGITDLTLEQRVTGLEHLMEPLPARIGTLEDKVHELDTWAGPGQNDALSKNIIGFRAETNRKLDGLTKDLTKVGNDVNQLTAQFGGFRNEVSRLSGEIAELQSDTTEVKTKLKELSVVQDQQTRLVQRNAKLIDDQLFMAGGLKDNLREFQVEVADFKTEVSTEIGMLKGDFAEFKTEVKGALAEILDRLPAKGA
jgi:prefoldin subunit 5